MVSLDSEKKNKLKKNAIEEIIRRAKESVRSIVRPTEKKIMTAEELSASGLTGELALEETIEHTLASGPKNAPRLVYEARIFKKSPVLVVMDSSLSMTGEKIALLAVAAAVIAMSVKPEDLAMAAFASQFKVIKKFKEKLSVHELVGRVLEIPSHGLTNLELALQEAHKMAQSVRKEALGGRVHVVLISDGKYTEGKDPAYLGSRFDSLKIIKIGKDISGRPLLYDLVRNNRGAVQEVRNMRDLPLAAYKTVRSILRH